MEDTRIFGGYKSLVRLRLGSGHRSRLALGRLKEQEAQRPLELHAVSLFLILSGHGRLAVGRRRSGQARHSGTYRELRASVITRRVEGGHPHQPACCDSAFTCFPGSLSDQSECRRSRAHSYRTNPVHGLHLPTTTSDVPSIFPMPLAATANAKTSLMVTARPRRSLSCLIFFWRT